MENESSQSRKHGAFQV
uniref:Uncharacterized protein n=1 Tax=Moniliophthora roreri TaxID=221103 RepID=A0A0W0G8T7_MONRR